MIENHAILTNKIIMLNYWPFQRRKKCVKCAPLLAQSGRDILHIGPYQLKNQLIVAPMAGVTDRPFRELCLRYGAGMAVSEMMRSEERRVGKEC